MEKFIKVIGKDIHNWKAYELSADKLKIGVIPLGGRIISLEFCGEEFFFVQEEHAGDKFDFTNLSVEELEERKKVMGFRLWGGDKTWVAPQSKWRLDIPPLVLDAGWYDVELQGQRIKLRSPLDPETGLQISREITLHINNELELKQIFYNHSDKDIEWGIWDVSQILRNIYVCIPVEVDKIVPYPEEGDSVKMLDKLVHSGEGDWTSIHCNAPIHFKYGAIPNRGHILTFKKSKLKNNFLIMERTFNLSPDAKYAHDVVVEVYNSPTMNYSEVEVHAPLQTIAPGKSVEYSQTWRFRKATREDIRKITGDTNLSKLS